VVRESYHALRQACGASRAATSFHHPGESSSGGGSSGSRYVFSAAADAPPSHSNVHISHMNQSTNNQTGDNKCDNWGVIVSETKWFQHLSSVLRGGLRCAEYLAMGDPVLVHCSDGYV
jgi:hypothetical protein